MTVSTLEKWIVDKGLLVDKNIKKLKRHEKEAALLQVISVSVLFLVCMKYNVQLPPSINYVISNIKFNKEKKIDGEEEIIDGTKNNMVVELDHATVRGR